MITDDKVKKEFVSLSEMYSKSSRDITSVSLSNKILLQNIHKGSIVS